MNNSENHSSQNLDMGGNSPDPSKVSDSLPIDSGNGIELMLFVGKEDESEKGSNNTLVLVEAQSAEQEHCYNSGNKFNILIDLMEEEDSEKDSTVPTEGEEHLFTDHIQNSVVTKGKQIDSAVCTRSKSKNAEGQESHQKRMKV